VINASQAFLIRAIRRYFQTEALQSGISILNRDFREDLRVYIDMSILNLGRPSGRRILPARSRPVLIQLLSFAAACSLFILPAQAQRGEGPLVKAQPNGISVQDIINRFAEKEKQFQIARERYTYKQSNIIQTLDGDTVDGEYRQDWSINFDNQGKRTITVDYAPTDTLTRISMTSEDLNDMQNVMPFVLTTEEIPDYNILYLGQQKEDELNTYVFDISPKQIDKKHRRFEGRIWVDNQDFQIVKTYGKSVPDIHSGSQENLFPRFTTYREQIDNVYWFPTYTSADDTLHFKSGDVRIRVIIKYTDYKRFVSESTIIFDGQKLPNATDQQQPPQQQPHQQPPK